MEAPMVVDGGNAGLAQSMHHPLAEVGAYNAPPQRNAGDTGGGEKEEDTLIPMALFKDLVIPGKEEEFERRLGEVLAKTRRERVADASETNVNEELKKLHDKIDLLAKTMPKQVTATGKPSWAAVAAGVMQGGRSEVATYATKVVVPERRNREVVIRAPGQGEDLAKRSAVQVVEAVNKAMGSEGAVAARRMHSGDTVLTFTTNAENYTKDTKWVEEAFGAKAEVKRREFAVMVKGMPAARLRSIHDPKDLLYTLQKRTPEISRCRVKLPKSQRGRFAEVILHMSSVAAAQAVCRAGVIFEAQIFNVEPYYPEAQVRRCFRCHAFGHIGRYCDKQARCGHCAAAAHLGGEENCPQKAASGKKRCVNCRGAHTAWDRDCPRAEKERERAQEAYKFRPLQFEVSQGNPVAAPASVQRPSSDAEGFQVVSNKRQRPQSRPAAPRGRPTGLRMAAQTNRSIEAYTSRESSIVATSRLGTEADSDPFA
jgi:hypothetical protein